MYRLLVLPVLLLVVGVAAAGKKDPPAGREYTSADGRFVAAFPGKEVPNPSTKEVATAAGVLTVNTVRTEVKDVIYSVTWADYPEPFRDLAAKTLLDGVVTGAKGKDGKVTEDTEFVLDPDGAKFVGRKFRVETGRNEVRGRLVIDGRRLYQVLVTGPRTKEESKVATAFFDSFRVGK